MVRKFCLAVGVPLLWIAATATADDVTDADALLCAATGATICADGAGCDSGPPAGLNIPQFIVVDLDEKVLKTTPASGEKRSTPIGSVQRKEGTIVLQGFENGRAFSFLIDEETGLVTVAVARDGVAVSVFGACTPHAD